MIIKYIVVETIKKSGGKKENKFEHGEIDFPCTWEDGEDQTELRQAIYAKHPGKSLVSYCPVEYYGKMVESINSAQESLRRLRDEK